MANAKRKALRGLIAGPGILVMPGVFDGFSTRLSESSGFKAALVSGAGLSEAMLGWADIGLMGYAENVNAARALAAISGMALIADADTGYGNAVNVHFTVRGFEDAGLAGVMIEDQVWPKKCGHMKGKDVVSAEEGSEKIRAAASARRDKDLVILARTDALAKHGLADAIRRLNLYAEAGADLLFADALLTVDHIRTAAKEVTKPLLVNMGYGIRRRSTTPLLSARQLQDLGVAVVLYPRLLTSAALQGMKNGIAALKESLASGKIVDRPELAVSFEELNELMGFAEVQRIEKQFLTAEQFERRYTDAT